MAKLKEVAVSLAYKKSLPNYENITFYSGVTLTAEDGDTHKKVYKEAWDIVGAEIDKQLTAFNEPKKSGISKGL